MSFSLHRPSEPLATLVRSIWSSESEANTELPGLIAPDSHVEFVFQFGSTCTMRRTGSEIWEHQPRSMLYAQRHTCVRLRTSARNEMIAFRTSPVVASLILERSLDDLWDQPVALADLMGAPADDLADQLACATTSRRFLLVERWLRERLQRWDADHARLERIHTQLVWRSSGAPVGAMAAGWGVSVRSLRRQIRNATGLSPKQLELSGRILRSCALLQERGDCSVSMIAQDLGFSDHAAFTNAFLAQNGLTPSAFRAEPLTFYERGPA